MNASQAWGILAAISIIVMPLVYEGLDIYRAFRKSKRPDEPRKDQTYESLNGAPVSAVRVQDKNDVGEDVVYVL